MTFSEKQNEFLKPGENAPHPDQFVRRHIGPRPADAGEMLKLLGYANLDAMIDAAVPKPIRLARPLQLPAARNEHEALAALKDIASQNQDLPLIHRHGLSTIASRRLSFSAMFWKIPAGTRNTRPIRRKFPRAGSKRS